MIPEERADARERPHPLSRQLRLAQQRADLLAEDARRQHDEIAALQLRCAEALDLAAQVTREAADAREAAAVAFAEASVVRLDEARVSREFDHLHEEVTALTAQRDGLELEVTQLRDAARELVARYEMLSTSKTMRATAPFRRGYGWWLAKSRVLR